MKRYIFRRVEKCLYEYPTNLIRLASLVEELNLLRVSGDIHGQSYNTSGAASGCADPVANYFAQIENVEQRINKLAQQLNQITLLHDTLKDSQTLDAVTSADYKNLLQRFYFAGVPLENFLNDSSWSRSKFYRRRLGLIQLAREYLKM